jgi:hypothetical protein
MGTQTLIKVKIHRISSKLTCIIEDIVDNDGAERVEDKTKHIDPHPHKCYKQLRIVFFLHNSFLILSPR